MITNKDASKNVYDIINLLLQTIKPFRDRRFDSLTKQDKKDTKLNSNYMLKIQSYKLKVAAL